MTKSRKAPVSQADVSAAMRELREEGLATSVRQVQNRVGRGSLGTISKLMAKVSEGVDTPDRHLESFPTRLEALCLEMVGVLDELATERVAAEREKVEAQRRHIEEKWNNLMLEKEAAVHGLDAERKANAELRSRLVDATQKLEETADQLGESKTRTATAEAQVAQLTERLEEAVTELERERAYITNYDTQVKLQRQRDLEEHTSIVSAKEAALNASKSNELLLTSMLGEVGRESDKLATQLREQTLRAEQAVAGEQKQQELVAHLSVEQEASKKREARREELLLDAQAVRDSLHVSVNSLQGKLIEAQERIDQLRENGTAESRSVIHNLILHARRALELAQAGTNKGSTEVQELGIAQKEIERMFGA
ncbi:DNA-binding protein [Pseudomonas sp. MWU12-2323]|uniref:DNA-binding protein n=1 Tax=Pseudomonas sp. MWU12-2323 TaxID=2651296 RepID=UPI0015B731B0|nr:DNA-binding protein [Pseudomonas sp. MWU12-2323]